MKSIHNQKLETEKKSNKKLDSRVPGDERKIKLIFAGVVFIAIEVLVGKVRVFYYCFGTTEKDNTWIEAKRMRNMNKIF